MFLDGCKNRQEAYGFLCGVLEVVAERYTWDPGARPAVTYSATQWARCLDSQHHQVRKYMAKLGVIPWITVGNPWAFFEAGVKARVAGNGRE